MDIVIEEGEEEKVTECFDECFDDEVLVPHSEDQSATRLIPQYCVAGEPLGP